MRTHPYAFLPQFILLSLLLLTATALAAPDAPPAGSVKDVFGEALVSRKGAPPEALKSGDRVYENDVLTTGKNSSMGLVLRDNSTMSLGPGTRIVLERFLFSPEKNQLSSITRITEGSLACASGEITKLRPEASKVLGPGYSIGIRGTHFLISVPPGMEDAATGASLEVRQ